MWLAGRLDERRSYRVLKAVSKTFFKTLPRIALMVDEMNDVLLFRILSLFYTVADIACRLWPFKAGYFSSIYYLPASDACSPEAF